MKTVIATSILLAACLSGIAQAQTVPFDDWFVINANDNSGDVIAATTTDGSGKELLGYRCFAKTQECVHVLIADTTCEDQSEYPMLLNAPSGSSLVKGICSKTANSDQLLITPYAAIRPHIENGTGVLGFAIPMRSGAFKAVRFSLKGSTAATGAAERLVRERARSRPTGRVGSGTF